MAKDRDKILRLVATAKFAGELPNPQGIGAVKEPNCADELCFAITTHREIITGIAYTITAEACYPAKAAAEAAARLAFEKPVMEAYLIGTPQIAEALGGLDKEDVHCAMMAELALKHALIDYVKKRNTQKA